MSAFNNSKKLLNIINTTGIDSLTSDELISILIEADNLYYNNDNDDEELGLLSDIEYDNIKKYTQHTNPTHPYFLGVGSAIRGNKIKLPFQMGSLDQIHVGEITTWINQHSLVNEQAIITDKLDGTSGLVIYDTNGNFQISYSRGDGIMGADTSRHTTLIPSILTKINYNQPIVIRGEVIISTANFEKAKHLITTRGNKEYKNARNCISGLMNASSNSPDVYPFIDFVAYEIVGSESSKQDQLELLKSLGFNVPYFQKISFNELNDDWLENYLITRKQQSDYEIDGIVIDVDDQKKRGLMNPTKQTLNPAYSVKYKVMDSTNIVIAEVVDVDINISKHGYLKPRVEIIPINIVGVTVTWATGFNMKFIKDNQIGPGSRVTITRAGDVVPCIIDVITPSTVSDYQHWLDLKLSSFGKTTWTETGVDLVLIDSANNLTVKFEQLVDFFDTIGAPHLGAGNLQKIFEMGFETPESIISLTKEDISNLLNSTIMGKKIFLGMKEKLTNIPLYKLMGAHPIFGRGIGVRKMKKLYDAFAGDMSKCSDINNIMEVDGFEKKSATKVFSGYPKFLDFLNEINTHITIAPFEIPKNGKLSNTIVVFTGFRNSQLEKQIESIGGKIGSSISNKTGLVVANDPSGKSSKLDKARDLGIKIISVLELMDIIQ